MVRKAMSCILAAGYALLSLYPARLLWHSSDVVVQKHLACDSLGIPETGPQFLPSLHRNLSIISKSIQRRSKNSASIR